VSTDKFRIVKRIFPSFVHRNQFPVFSFVLHCYSTVSSILNVRKRRWCFGAGRCLRSSVQQNVLRSAHKTATERVWLWIQVFCTSIMFTCWQDTIVIKYHRVDCGLFRSLIDL
jgi:hypothetical protein